MKKLDESIKLFNLAFTDTLLMGDFSRVDFDLDKEKVNYDNCVNLYDLVNKFNRLNLLFKKEYHKLDKLDLGKKVEVLDFNKSVINNDNYRVLTMCIDKPTITNHSKTFLYLREVNGENSSFVTNGINRLDKDYYHEEINIDKEIVKKYLDLFEKYSLLLDLYDRFSNGLIFGDGTFSMYSKIESDNNNILDQLDRFNIDISFSPFMSSGNHISLSVKMGDVISIDGKNSMIQLGDKILKGNKEIYLKILKSIYLHGKYLNNYCDRQYNKEKIKLKSLVGISDRY